MRVIAGQARGLRLKVPTRVTRPSTDRLREALFSILGARVEGASVLDLFAGSGALGLEALSRGAAKALFVESNRQAARVIAENLARTKLNDSRKLVRIIDRDVFAALRVMRERFDLIFADPPYASRSGTDLAAQLLRSETLPARLERDGLLVVEVESERDAPEEPLWSLEDVRTYGSSAILFYAPREQS